MRILVIGGAACGKSEYAEAAAVTLSASEPRYYIATMMPFSQEDYARIEKHRAMRAEKGFLTMERYTDLGGLLLPMRGTVLLECLGNLTANELFADGGARESAFDVIIKGIESLEAQSSNLVVVTNDVFSDGTAYAEETQRYIDILAEVNRTLAVHFDSVVELCCGIPLYVKGGAV